MGDLDIKANETEFKSIVKQAIHRDGIDDLMAWLDTTDFYRAPASARYHGAVVGGLCAHSLATYKYLKNFQEDESDETIAIVSLFHDLCKADLYKESTRNAKNEEGQWVKVPFYEYDDKFPLGHGEKSMYLLMKYMKLTDEEAATVRWHMGGYMAQNPGETQALSTILRMFKLVLKLQTADQCAAFWECM